MGRGSIGEAGGPELSREPGLGLQPGKGACRLGKPPRPAASSSAAEMERRRGGLVGGMNDAPLAAAASNAAAASPSLPLLPLIPGGDGEGLGDLTDMGVAVDNRGTPHHPPPPSSLAPPPLICCSQSASRRLFMEAAGLRLLEWKLSLQHAGL